MCIKDQYFSGDYTQKELCIMYDLSRKEIGSICRTTERRLKMEYVLDPSSMEFTKKPKVDFEKYGKKTGIERKKEISRRKISDDPIKKCPKCGAVVSATAVFCGKCGCKLEDNLETETTIFSQGIPLLKIYEKQIHELEASYKIKEKTVREITKKCFTPPQLTYDRFITTIDSCNQIFYKQTDAALSIINVATKHTHPIDEELKKKIDTLKSLIEKIDDLTNELAINLSNSNGNSYSDEVKDLLDDMKDLIDSVKEYG